MSPNTQSTSLPALRYSGIQPQYFPRLHYFNRILSADLFMVRDDVQFVKSHKYPEGHRGPSYQAHTPIKNSSGVYLLNVPMHHSGLNPIYQTTLSHREPWRQRHLKTIYSAHANSPYFDNIYPQIEKIISKEHRSLAELNLDTILWAIVELAGLNEALQDNVTLDSINDFLNGQSIFRLKTIKRASQSQFYRANSQAQLSANEKIIGLCKEVGATEDFCGGTAAVAYMDNKLFAQNGIKTVVQDWQCPDYPQLFNKKMGFLPNLSIIDLLMNVPVDEARLILKGQAV